MLRRLAAALVLAALPLAAPAEDGPALETVAVDDTTTVAIAHMREASTDVLMVIRDYELVWSQSGYMLAFGAPPGQEIAPGTDITGSGIAELLVSEFTGGAHCCTTYHILALEPFVRVLATIDTQDAGARFEDLDGRPGLEAITADTTFAYWNTYYAASPKPQVVLAWNGSAYVATPALMAAPAPSAGDLKAEAAAVAASDQWTADQMDPDLWRTMLDLIYTGHADLAWSFLDDGWPQGRDGKDAFRTALLCQLATSPYWDAVSQMNGLDAPTGCPAADS